MLVKNARLYPTAFLYGKSAPTQWYMSFVVKATFLLNTTRTSAKSAAKQLPILTSDVPYDADSPESLLQFESDLVPFKPRADVVLVGSAHSPRARPTKVLDIEIRVGNTQQLLRIFGDRVWSYPNPAQPAPLVAGPIEFVTMPLRYDRAFGGIDKHTGLNPLVPRFRPWCAQNFGGRGYIGLPSVDSVDKIPLPNLEDPNELIRDVSSHPRPVGCGFFPRVNEPRASFAGTYDEKWEAERAPELPEDFRFDFFNGAHPYLQVEGYLRGDEPVTLTHVSRVHERFEFRLPGVCPVLEVRSHPWPSDAAEPDRTLPLTERRIVPNLDTLVFVPDEGVFFQVWRGIIPIRDPAALEVSEVRVEYHHLPEVRT